MPGALLAGLLLASGGAALAAATGDLHAAVVTLTNSPPETGHIFKWRPFLAPFHAVVLHFPIGFLTIAFLLEIYRRFRPSPVLRPVTALITWLSLVTGVLSAGLGLLRATSGEYEARALDLHKQFGLAVPIATLAAIILQRQAYRDESVRLWTRLYRTALSASVALLVVAGHYGGNLTHGSKYLVENAPEFVRDLLDEPAPSASANAAAQDEHQRHFVEKVKPILEAKCYSCHGPDKQKGGYRMDQPAAAIKGGDSGRPAIKPGEPTESNLIRLILLSPNHDDVMPPEGKKPLTLEEMMILVDWVRNGAVFPPLAGAPATNSPAAAPPTTGAPR